MKRILITRPEPGASLTAKRLTALGFLPIIAPVLSIIPNNLRAPAHPVATLLTSQNAIMACPAYLHAYPVFAVGSATAARASEAGFNRVVNAEGDSVALVKLVADTLSPADGALFLPTALGQGIDLAKALRQLGFRVVRRVAYQAAAVHFLPDLATANLREGDLTAALFFSAETARHFVQLVKAANLANAVISVEAVSISARAAVPLSALPWRRISVAAKPNQDEMLVLLK